MYVTIRPLTRPTQVKTEKVSTRDVKKVKGTNIHLLQWKYFPSKIAWAYRGEQS